MLSINETLTLINEFKNHHMEDISNIEEASLKISNATNIVERSWSGSYAGWHGEMYFKDFKIPSIEERFNGEWGGLHEIPDGWHKKEPEEIQIKIEALVGNGFKLLDHIDHIEKLRDAVNKLRSEILINLSVIEFNESTLKEKALYDQIDTFVFGELKGSYIANHIPKNVMSRGVIQRV